MAEKKEDDNNKERNQVLAALGAEYSGIFILPFCPKGNDGGQGIGVCGVEMEIVTQDRRM